MQSSREIVLANLNRQPAERPAFDYGNLLSDIAKGFLGPSKIYTQKRWIEGHIEYFDDDWGNVWFRMVDGSQRGEIYRPVLQDWGELASLTLPDWGNPDRYLAMQTTFAKTPDQYHLTILPGWVFASSRYLRKMEIYFTDLIEYREEIDDLHGRITELLKEVIRGCATAGADAVIFAEDLGVQDRTLISPAMWRDIFRPHYLELTGLAHQCGLKVFMHSCGYNWALIDDLIEAGIDCLQFDQPAIYDMPALAAKLRAHSVALHSPVDIQKVLPTGDREFIEAEATRMVDTFRGGLIITQYPDLAGIGIDAKWDRWAFDACCRASGIAIPDSAV